jgi:hypothetical protein
MTTQIQRRRGTTAEHASFTGALGELTVDTDKNTVVVHDGSTGGGFPLALETHSHSASAISGSGVIAITNGGTGASTAASALTALGAAASAHNHDSSDIEGFGSQIRYVIGQSAFASAYSGSSKTIVLGPGPYTLPGSFLPTVNLISDSGPENVTLTGGVWATAGTASGTTTVLRNITVNGTLSVSAGWSANLRLENVNASILEFADASSLVEVIGGEISRFDHSDGTFRTFDTKITGGGSVNRGGTAVHKNLHLDVSSTQAALGIGTGLVEETKVEFVGATNFVIAVAPATHWRLNAPVGEFYVWYSAGAATDPAASGTGIQVSASTVDNADTVASNTASAINANINFAAAKSAVGAIIDIVNASVGSVVDAFDVNASLVQVSTLVQGVNSSSSNVTIQGLEFKNPGGAGVQITSSSLVTIDGAIAGSILVAGISVAANAILRLGTHNLTSSQLVAAASTNLAPLVAPLGTAQIVSSNFAVGAVDSAALEASAVGRFHLEGAAKRTIHKTFIPIIGTVTGLGIPGGLSGSTIPLALNQIVIHPEFMTDGYIRLLRIETVDASATLASSMNFDLVRYSGRAIGTAFSAASTATIAFSAASTATIASAQNFDSNGYVLSRSALAAAANAVGVSALGGGIASADGAGWPIFGANDPDASVGEALVISVSSMVDGSAIQNLMVTYLLQGADS